MQWEDNFINKINFVQQCMCYLWEIKLQNAKFTINNLSIKIDTFLPISLYIYSLDF